jgi:hypothetical protein
MVVIIVKFISFNQIVIFNNKETYLFSLSIFIPVKIYKNLFFPEEFRSDLNKIGGVYGIINISN